MGTVARRPINPFGVEAMAAKLVIIGAGGHGRVCADVALAAEFDLLGFCDSAMAPGDRVGNHKVLATSLEGLGAKIIADKPLIFAAIGDNARRMALLDEARAMGLGCATLVHPSAVLSPSASIGEGSVVVAGAVVNADSRVGPGCIVNTACSLDHDNDLAAGVQICPGVHAAGNVQFGEQAFVGTGAAIIPGIKIGARAVVAAGAVVTRDVADDQMVAGVPAAPVRG